MERKGVLVGAAIVVLKDGKVLLGKRANDGGMWSFPGGGVEPGEGVEAAAARELLEEAGLKASELEFVGFIDSPLIFLKNTYSLSWVTMVFKCNRFSGSVKVCEPHKMCEWKWFSKEELPPRMFKHTADAIGKKMVWKD